MNALEYYKQLNSTGEIVKFLEQATSIDLRIKDEICDRRKRPKYREAGGKEKLEHNCVTIWNGMKFSTKLSIHEVIETNKRVMGFLNVEDNSEMVRYLDVKYLKKFYLDALLAAENGYLSCKQAFRSNRSLPSLVNVTAG